MKLGSDVLEYLTYLSPRAHLICSRDNVTSHLHATYTNVMRDKKLCLSCRLKCVGRSEVVTAYITTVILITINVFNNIQK